MNPKFIRPVGAVLAVVLLAAVASGHAILVKSIPAVNQTVIGPDVPVVLTFNSRLDQARSILTLEGPDHSSSRVEISVDRSSPARLSAKLSNLHPGPYQLRWQVLAVDGHITRGAIPFRVK
jgi:methionine-rich copper-binding protein CopC